MFLDNKITTPFGLDQLPEDKLHCIFVVASVTSKQETTPYVCDVFLDNNNITSSKQETLYVYLFLGNNKITTRRVGLSPSYQKSRDPYVCYVSLDNKKTTTHRVGLSLLPEAGIMEADDREVITVFTVQPSFHHRHPTNPVS